jgi:polyferredoxin
VCPTGIDIRNGTQLECVNCTACIDACDEVMDKVGRERGLIRYDSYNGIKENRKKIFTPRAIAYSSVLMLLVALNIFLLTQRSDVEVTIMRTAGMLYQEVDEDQISNLYNFQMVNKTNDTFPVDLRIKGQVGQIKLVGQMPLTMPGEVTNGAFFIEMPKNVLEKRNTPLTIQIIRGEKLIDEVKTQFLGPIK